MKLWSDDIENILKTLNLSLETQKTLQNVMAEYYTQKRIYKQNSSRIRNRLLLDLKNGVKVDLKQYEQAFKEISEEYIQARIVFYCAVAENLDTENMNKLLEKIWE